MSHEIVMRPGATGRVARSQVRRAYGRPMGDPGEASVASVAKWLGPFGDWVQRHRREKSERKWAGRSLDIKCHM